MVMVFDKEVIDCSKKSASGAKLSQTALPQRRATITYVAYPTTPARMTGITRAVQKLIATLLTSTLLCIMANT